MDKSKLVPNDAQNVAFQIAYTVARVHTNTSSSRLLGPVIWQYVPFGSSVQYPFGNNPRSLSVDPTDISKVECYNYYARWCGDGIVSNSEVCDPADTSKTAW